jgi:hypothetical protein
MLDGILRDQGDRIAESIISLFKLEGDVAEQIRTRLLGLTI